MGAGQDLQRAIVLMRDGEVEAAVPLLLRLRDAPELDDKGRAAANVWLAETRDAPDFKRRCLEQALRHEPDNAQIRRGLQRLERANGASLQRPPVRAPQVAGVSGGLNGAASGIFVSESGLLATTSYAVGSRLEVTVSLNRQSSVPGRVMRRYPGDDLAFIETGLSLFGMPAMRPAADIIDQMALLALSYGGFKLRAQLLPGGGGLSRRWLRASLPLVQLQGGGGEALYDSQGQLLGLLTRNGDAAGMVLALTMTRVRALAERYRREQKLMPESLCCPHCGGLTRARVFGGKTCEHCGGWLPGGNASDRVEPNRDKLKALYGEDRRPPCPVCGARVGHYDERCLRCGRAMPALAGLAS